MSDFLFSLLAFAGERAKDSFVRKTRQMQAVQERFLKHHLQYHQTTEVGRQYNVGNISSIDEFRDRVPVSPYSAYEAYTERIASGETNILNPDPVVFMSRTSGSTGKRKMIPVTRRFQNSLGWPNLIAIGFASAATRSRGKKVGRVIATNAAATPEITPGGIEFGSAATGVLRMGKFLYEQLFVYPFEVLQVKDVEARNYLCWLFSLQNTPKELAANFPMVALQMCQYLEHFTESLLEDIEIGSISDRLKIEPQLRLALENQLRPNPKRAAELRSLLQMHGRLAPKFLWPDLSFVGTAQGGTSDFYLQRFPYYFGDISTFGVVYASAEGTFGIYHSLDDCSSVLAIDSGFYEFIPPEEWESDNPKTVLPWEVKPGEYYRLVCTNYSGFYRYDIGDVVEIGKFYNDVPTLIFRHRRGGLLSAFTEKTTEDHATQTLKRLQQKFNVYLDDFCITLSENDFPPAYIVNIELASGQTLADPQAFIAAFDRLLAEANFYYGVKRKDGMIPPPRLRILAPGSFAIVRQRHIEKGIPDYQLKFPHISEDRSLVADLEVKEEVAMV